MIISVDGYDGTGKTTLAKKIAQTYGFNYLYKPIIYKTMELYNCTYEEASKIVEEEEKILFTKPIDYQKVAKYYNEVLLWLKKYQNDYDIILDRGILTTYAVVGSPLVENIFDYYIENGAFFSGSIYLTADDNERVRRIYNNNPNDPDLKYPVKWRENNLEEYAEKRKLNVYKIKTDNRSKIDVFNESYKFIDDVLSTNHSMNRKIIKLSKERKF